jgi:quercetin dioxygenase-like cupin family protein
MPTILKPGDYQWRETAGGTGWSLLRHDPAGDTQTRLLRYAPTTIVPAARLDHSVEWFVTRGEARCGDLELRRGGFFCWPRGYERPAIDPGAEGFTVLSMVYGPASSIRKPLVAIPDVEQLPWQMDIAATVGTQLEMRLLSGDPESGAVVELWRLPPDAPLPLSPAAAPQEFYVLQGSLRWGSERIPRTTYLAFAPGEERGALAAEGQGVVLFVITHPG